MPDDRPPPLLESRNLSPENVRVRCYHEAGHALMALHLGVRLKVVYGGEIARTIHEPDSLHRALARIRALITLAGGAAEDVQFGGRSPDCCTDDLKSLENTLAELLNFGEVGCSEAIHRVLKEEVRETLARPAFRSALDVLAHELIQNSMIAGAWAPELLCGNARASGPF